MWDPYDPDDQLRILVACGCGLVLWVVLLVKAPIAALVCLAVVVVAVVVKAVVGSAIEMRRIRLAHDDLRKRAASLRRQREEARRQQEAELGEQLARAVARTTQADRPPRKLVSLDDAPADVKLVAPGTLLVARATRTLGVCPLCQTNILEGEDYLSCPACKAHYHPDCWEYNRGCAVYGCSVRLET